MGMTPIEKDPSKGFNAVIAATIRAERGARRMTIDDLARESDIPRRTLIRILNEERAVNIEHLAAIADAYGLTVTELVKRAEDRSRRRNIHGIERIASFPADHLDLLAADDEGIDPAGEAEAFEDLP